MGLLAVPQAVAALSFLTALAFLFRARHPAIDGPARACLGVGLAMYALVELDHLLGGGAPSNELRVVDRYARDLFIPFFLFGLVAMGSRWEFHRRKAAEDELRTSREQYQTLVESVDLGITLLSADATVLSANRAIARMLQQSPEDLVGRKCYLVYQHRTGVCEDCPGDEAFREKRATVVDKTAVRKDGTDFPVRVHAYPLFTPSGQPQAFIEVVEDRTEENLLEEKKRLFEGQLLRAQKAESLEIFAGGVAHDFNNLLMGVVGNADLTLLKLPADSPCRAYVQRIQSAASRAAELTSQLVAYSRRGVSSLCPVDLNQVVETTAALIESVVSKKTLLRYRLEPGLPSIEADATQLRQILMNLTVNASEALGAGPGVVTTATGVSQVDRSWLAAAHLGHELAEGIYVFLQVSDNGTGMDPETLGRLFDPFFTTKFTGRGLGLPAVLGVVREHRGAIRVESEPGKGSVFQVLFPISGRPSSLPAVGEPRDRTPSGEGLGKNTILVVDDEETVRSVCRMMLEEFGFTVQSAANGREALEIFREHAGEVAAVVLDLAMPEMDGEETLAHLRQLRNEVPVVLSSGFEEQAVLSRFEGQVYASFLRKPYRCEELLDAVRRAISAPREIKNTAR